MQYRFFEESLSPEKQKNASPSGKIERVFQKEYEITERLGTCPALLAVS